MFSRRLWPVVARHNYALEDRRGALPKASRGERQIPIESRETDNSPTAYTIHVSGRKATYEDKRPQEA